MSVLIKENGKAKHKVFANTTSGFEQLIVWMRERGKCKMAVIGAAMRKLIHLAYGVLKTGKPFDRQWAKAA